MLKLDSLVKFCSSKSVSLPSSDSEVSDGVVVRPEDLGIEEHFVTKSVEPLQGDPDVGGRDPGLELRAVLEVVGAGSALEGGEGDFGSGQGGHVGELGGTEGPVLVDLGPAAVPWLDDGGGVGQLVSISKHELKS